MKQLISVVVSPRHETEVVGVLSGVTQPEMGYLTKNETVNRHTNLGPFKW